MLTVHFEIYRRTDRQARALDPIVGIEGGPGFSSIASAPSYLAMIGPLHARHNLLVMDDRGTGSSGAIDCPALQRYSALAQPRQFVAAVDACRRQLGRRANAYGTMADGDDLAFILAALHIGSADVYGDSYGGYAAQSFTLHHKRLVRALVIDGAFNNSYNPLEPEGVAALRHAWTAVCRRSPGCGTTSMLGAIAHFTRRLQRRPVTGAIVLTPRSPAVKVDLTAPAFAQLVYDAGYSADVFTDLPAALRAFAAGDRQPLLRLAANDIEFNASGPARYFSIGDLEAVSCNDYPTAWARTASPAVRRRQLAAQIARLHGAFAPFPASVYLRSYVENELTYGCLDWPSASPAHPAFPHDVRYPDTPTLIFDGEFDFATPLADAERVARAWPHSTFVEVANSKHVTAAGDQEHCASVILQRFLTTLKPGNTACARQIPPVAILPAFPRSLTAAPEVRSLRGDPPTIDRQAAWVAVETVADAMSGWFGSGIGAGSAADALRGGTVEVAGDKFSNQSITVRLRAAQFVAGVRVAGTAVWDRHRGRLRAHLILAGPAGLRGKLRVTWRTGIPDWRQPADIVGVLGRHPVDAEMRAPWEPQG